MLPIPGQMSPVQIQMQQQAVQQQNWMNQQPLTGPMPIAPQAPLVGPTPPPGYEESQRYGGAWQTVEYKYQGTTYVILMPVENTKNLPEGARPIGDPIVDEPNRVQVAEQTGQQGQQGDHQMGLLSQMPPEIQGVFLSDTQQGQIDQQNPAIRSQNVENNLQAINDMGFSAPHSANTQPGEDELFAMMDTMQAEDEKEANFEREGAEQFIINERSRQPLTTEALRVTDPVKAGILESAGIFEVPVDRMVVRDQQGNVYLVPAQEQAPEGMEIITYGGATPSPSEDIGEGRFFDKRVGNPWEWFTSIAENVLDVPARGSRAVVSTLTDQISQLPEPAQGFIVNVLQGGGPGSPLSIGSQLMGGDLPNIFSNEGQAPPGVPAFVEWQLANPELADAARNNGYNGFTGERAVWERFQADRTLPERALDALFTDPSLLTATGTGGAVRRVGQEAENIPGIGRIIAPLLDETGRILEVPEQIMNEAVDVGVAGARNLGNLVRRIPAVDNLFDDTVETVTRNAREEVETQLTDVVRQPAIPRTPEELAPPVARTAPDAPVGATNRQTQMVMDGRADDVARTTPTEIIPDREPDILGPDAPSSTAPDLAIDRPVDDLGTVQRGLTPAEQPLAVDRPVDDLRVPDQPAPTALEQAPPPRAPETPEQAEIRVARERDFQQTKDGRQLTKIVNSWPESMSYLRPQTADQRLIGEGRVGMGFDQRPVDVARAIAPEEPQRALGFFREYDRALRRKNGYIALEGDRQTRRVYDHFQSSRFPDQREDGRALRRTAEILFEADDVVNVQTPLFNKHFGDVADLPEYAWKRWNYGGGEHTALDTLEQSGGVYRAGTDLAEATELAIFHPDPKVRADALDDIQYRLSTRRDDGSVVTTQGGASVLHPSLKKVQPLRDVLSNARNARLSIRRLSENYQQVREANASLASPERLNPEDARRLSIQSNQLTESEAALADPEGAARFEADLARAEVADMARGERVYNLDAAASDLAAVGEDAEQLARGLPQGELPAPGRRRLIGQQNLTPEDGSPLSPRPASGDVPIAMPAGDRLPPRLRQKKQLIGNVSVADDGSLPTADALRAERNIPPRNEEYAEAVRSVQEWRRSVPEADVNPPGKQRALPDAMTDADMESLYVRGRVIAAEQMKTLGQKFSDNGESIIARWDRYVSEDLARLGDGADIAEVELDAAQRVINDWTVDNMDQRLLNVYEKELRAAAKRRIDDPDAEGGVRKASALEAQISAIERAMQQGTRTRAGRAWDEVMAALRETFLYNVLTGVRYVATQALGNTTTLMLTKHYGVVDEVLSPQAMKRAIQAGYRNGELPESVMTKVRNEYGLGGERMLTRGTSAVRDQGTSTLSDPMKLRQVPVLGRVSQPFASKAIRNISSTFDTMPREGLWAHIMDSNLAVARRNLREQMEARLPAGANLEEFTQAWDALPQRFGAADIRRVFGDTDARWADRAARDWQEAITKTDRMARDEVKRIFFDGGEKNIDRILKRVFFFHYWMSRATPLYTEAILRDPVYAYQFANMIEEMQEAYNDDEYGAGPYGFIKLMESPFGYNIMVRPDGLITTFASLWEASGYDPDGQNKLGKFLDQMPLMVNPIVNMTVNMLGMQGDTFLPDPVGANKFIQLAQNGIDFVNAKYGLGLPPARNPQEDLLAWARSKITSTLDWVPGIDPVAETNRMGYKENEVREIIATIAMERGLDVMDPQVQMAMDDPSSELYQEAMKRYAYQDTWDIASRILPIPAVLYPKSQLAAPKTRSAQISRDYAQSEELGRTGITPRQEQLYTERDSIAADSEQGREFLRMEDEYRGLGTAEERAALAFYYSIQYGNTTDDIWVNGTRYSPEQIAAMDENGRESLATEWAESSGNANRVEKLRAERAQYREDHPEYAEYTVWGNQIRDYPGGPQKWWEDVSEGNPNAARWYNGLSEEERQDGYLLTGVDAYFAFQGDKLNFRDPNPIDTATAIPPEPYNPISGDGGSSSGSSSGSSRSSAPTQKTISEDIQQYEREMADYNATVAQIFGQPVDVRDLNPMARNAVISNLEAAGIREPRMGSHLYGYVQWAQQQGGGDTSVATYIKWWEANNPGEETPEE